jgi:hypothetical protein
MKTIAHMLPVLLLFTFTTVQAASCRSGVAAARGGQSGYERDNLAAIQTAQNDRASSDALGKCVGSITAVITAPQFPSLSAIFDQLKNRVCQMASDQVNGAVYNANSWINQNTGGINDGMNNTGMDQIIGGGNTPRTGSVGIQQASPGSAESGNFWSNIWR